MAKKALSNIFLSASIPLKNRDAKYYETADIIAIRDAVIALATAILPKHKLIWGGHPSITPLIYFVIQKLGLDIQEHLTIYQSLYFEEKFPEDNNKFENVLLTDNLGTEELSVLHMRQRMFSENKFTAGVFIGGMEGLEVEFKMFRESYNNALLLPIASTGAAARLMYDNLNADKKNERMLNDYGYLSLFQELLLEKL
ncbi:MAG: hypothetical protein ABW007_12890 [Chitinophagaceae bacterium]